MANDTPLEDKITPINDSDLNMVATAGHAAELMKSDRKALRNEVLKKFPIEDFLTLINIDGEIEPENVAASQQFVKDWFDEEIFELMVEQSEKADDYGIPVAQAINDIGGK